MADRLNTTDEATIEQARRHPGADWKRLLSFRNVSALYLLVLLVVTFSILTPTIFSVNITFTVFIALIIGVPISLGIAIFLAYGFETPTPFGQLPALVGGASLVAADFNAIAAAAAS